MFRSCLAAAFLVAATSAQAAVISFGPTSAGGGGPTIAFNGLAAPTGIVGDATFTFTVNGDLDWSSEYVDITIDGVSLGRVFDNNSANDSFDFAGDRGNQSVSNLTGSATIGNAVMAGLIADGLLNLSFDFSGNVNCCGTVNLLEGSISYTDVAPVPVSASLPFLLAAVGGLGFAARRRKAS